MSNIAKRQGRMIRKGKEVRYGSVHIDLIGSTELLHNREAKGAAIDLLRTEILASKDCAKISPSLKRFRLISIRTQSRLGVDWASKGTNDEYPSKTITT